MCQFDNRTFYVQGVVLSIISSLNRTRMTRIFILIRLAKKDVHGFYLCSIRSTILFQALTTLKPFNFFLVQPYNYRFIL